MSDLIGEALSGKRGEDQQRIAEVGMEWVRTLLKKNSDYGSSVWEEPLLAPGMEVDSAIRVRMSDKIQRLTSLLKKSEHEVGDETFRDSVSDLGAYCLLWLARP